MGLKTRLQEQVPVKGAGILCHTALARIELLEKTLQEARDDISFLCSQCNRESHEFTKSIDLVLGEGS